MKHDIIDIKDVEQKSKEIWITSIDKISRKDNIPNNEFPEDIIIDDNGKGQRFTLYKVNVFGSLQVHSIIYRHISNDIEKRLIIFGVREQQYPNQIK